MTRRPPGGGFARIMRAVFARHSNPWSAWSRWATIPLVLLPVWTRSRGQAAAVAVWFVLNPVIFPRPVHDGAWSTRAMLGEERWMLDRPRDAALAVNAATTAAAVVALVGARYRRPLPTGAACAAQMALTLVYWEQMARYHDSSLERGDLAG